jgi:type II secretory pathway pseudopilin PulG
VNHRCDYLRLRKRRPAARRGVVLLVIIVLLSVSLVLFGVWARQAVNEQDRLETQQKRLQTILLARPACSVCSRSGPPIRNSNKKPGQCPPRSSIKSMPPKFGSAWRRALHKARYATRPWRYSPSAQSDTFSLRNRLKSPTRFPRIDHEALKSVRVYAC